ncbi:alanyl-tRNA editing protein Aarsd1-B-like isoform X2 [Oppia nitens]|uniref:alanyl-tRNA editing protein Aarsd1-B-like isoform X2 n=1 Tax=Oppia nitens TaxID=1686743 RepID=UPI0023DBE2A4|nr:alanyl-tRNA editing protein Aarsd1-B-like isoform X2 [Oppia nitens]
MLFKCQSDSYLKEFKTRVKSCKSNESKNKGIKQSGYEVILEDTILFPEGGGQPCDWGTIDDKRVVDVRRDGDTAIHFVLSEEPLEMNSEVYLRVDWSRRFDHMQQHSGQHLITAVAEQTYGLKTTSWNLGDEVSFIELDAKEVSDDTVRQLEELVNEKIRISAPVSVTLYDKNDKRLEEISTRLMIPEDQSGPIRVITIEGVDENTCCGTHVSNLSHLQTIKLLSAEKGKKNKTNLYFLCGKRVLTYLDKTYKREKLLNSSLKCTSEEFISMIDKLKKSLKVSQKNCLNAMRDLAKLEAKNFLEMNPKPKYVSIHRKESDIDFITIYLMEVKQHIDNTLVVLTVTDDSTNSNSSGQLALAGNQDLIQRFIPKLLEIMPNTKGFLKDGKYAAKVDNLAKRSKLDDILKCEFGDN